MTSMLIGAFARTLAWRLDAILGWAWCRRGQLRNLVTVQGGELRIRYGARDWKKTAHRLLEQALPMEDDE